MILIPQLELVVVSDHNALRSDTWQREIDLLGMPRGAAREKIESEMESYRAVGWTILDEREECKRPKQKLRKGADEGDADDVEDDLGDE